MGSFRLRKGSGEGAEGMKLGCKRDWYMSSRGVEGSFCGVRDWKQLESCDEQAKGQWYEGSKKMRHLNDGPLNLSRLCSTCMTAKSICFSVSTVVWYCCRGIMLGNVLQSF